MANNSNLSRRAALRQAQEMEERSKRNKRIMGFGLGLAALVVVVVLAIVIVQAVGNRTTVTQDQLTPPNATEKFGILIDGTKPSADKPHLIVYEDPRCPACASVESAFGPVVEQLVADGSITSEIRTASFFDLNQSGERIDDGPSSRAAIAAAAADEVGHYKAFHRAMLQNQQSGYTEQALRRDIPEAAGITGEALTRYQELYNTRAFKDFILKTHDVFTADEIEATPAYIVAGKRLNMGQAQPTPEAFLQTITAAWEAGDKQIEAHPEPYQRR